MDVAHGLLNALDFGLLLTQMLGHRAVERSLSGLDLGTSGLPAEAVTIHR